MAARGPQLELARPDASRAAQRGLGPPRRAVPLPLLRPPELPAEDTPWVLQGPVGPRDCLAIGCWWLLREVELSNKLLQDVTLAGHTVSINIRASKTCVRRRRRQNAHPQLRRPAGRSAAHNHRTVPGLCRLAAAFPHQQPSGLPRRLPIVRRRRGGSGHQSRDGRDNHRCRQHVANQFHLIRGGPQLGVVIPCGEEASSFCAAQT